MSLLVEEVLRACRVARENAQVADQFCGAVNAVSEHLRLEVRRGGRTWRQDYRRGEPRRTRRSFRAA